MVHRHSGQLNFNPHSLLWYFIGLSFILASSFLFPTSWSHASTSPKLNTYTANDHVGGLNSNHVNLTFELQHAPLIPTYSLTVVVPLTSQSLPLVEKILSPLLTPSAYILEIVVVCPVSIIPEARIALRMIESMNPDHPDIILHTLVGGLDHDSGVINAASQVSTEWVLLMNQHGLLQESIRTQALLLHPTVILVPVGPRGVSVSPGRVSCLPPSEVPQRASYLYPPFVMPAFLGIKLESASEDPWAALGHRISESRPDGLGGIAVDITDLDSAWCTTFHRTAIIPPPHYEWDSQFSNDDSMELALSQPDTPNPSPTSGMFAIFLPTLLDLHVFSSLGCILQKHSHDLKVFIYDLRNSSNKPGWDDRHFIAEECRLPYSIGLSQSPFPSRHAASDWLNTFSRPPDIILGLSEEDPFIGLLTIMYPKKSKLVRIPRSDLPYCGWMGSLSLVEWRSCIFLCLATLA